MIEPEPGEPDVLIAGMWGTTNLQLMLLQGEGGELRQVAGTRSGPGASALERQQFEAVLLELTRDWRARWPGAPVHLAGMVGSTIGWLDTGYGDCPSPPLATVLETRVANTALRVVGGLRCVNRLGEWDLLRGEETEVAGWLASSPSHQAGEQLLVVPGTHTKWIRVKDGLVTEFLTGVAGECFAGLAERGVLLPRADYPCAAAGDAFLDGVRTALAGGFSLLHSLFAVRARQVTGEASAADAAERLSGLLIGSDVAGAVEILGLRGLRGLRGAAAVIGSPDLARRYVLALAEAGLPAGCVGSTEAAAAGLWALRGAKQAVSG